MKKIVLSYSGGLDTSVMIKWLKEHYEAKACPVEVIALAVDLGQGEDFEKLRTKAIASGAAKIYIEDVQQEFIEEFIFPALKSNAIYEGKYLLATSLSRPLIAKKLVEVAKKENASILAHGCTGKGNDQVRFEVTIAALAPELEVLAPARVWEFKSREEEVEYALKHNIPVAVTKKNPYSIDKNLWGISIECGPLEDPWVEPPEDAYQITTSPQKAPQEPAYLEIGFEKGVPIKLDGHEYPAIELIERLNKIGGKYGIGRVDMVENRLVGLKSREVYESPAATILFEAHNALESLVLDRETAHFKQIISLKYAELIYYGLWYSPLKEALDGFVEKTQTQVTGNVRVKLIPGRAVVVGRESKYSRYSYKLATYSQEDAFDHRAAEGFIKIFGLPYRGIE
ncbi:MAG: argininosuccinate synthase [bacterium]|nr:argininosuccinate synthase [bacterium]